MLIVALQMLFRDTPKFFGIVMGVALASMVITWQGAIFVGLMSRTFALIADTGDADIWVMDEKVAFIDDTKPMQDTALFRVRSVEGVAWSMPFYKGNVRARLGDGTTQNCNLYGIDGATLAGGPPRMVAGRLEDLLRADAVIVDRGGAADRLAKIGPNNEKIPLGVGDTLELNDARAVVVGICASSESFADDPVVYTTYLRAVQFAPQERKVLSYVLVKANAGEDLGALTGRIREKTGLAAYRAADFRWKTVMYFMDNTGIPINFGIAMGLGFLVGAIITGFMFYSFTLDNLRYFGTLKAMGASDSRLMGMVLVQALVVAFIGFGLGVGLTSLMGAGAARDGTLAFRLLWQLLFMAGAAVLIICCLAAMVSLVRLVRLEPAIVFKG